MIAFIAIVYASLYFIVFGKLGLLKKTAGNIAAFAGIGVALIASILFMWQTYSPMSADARIFRYIIPIVPNVRGEVVEVPVEALSPLSKGDVLFRIDPLPYEIAVRNLSAQVARNEAEWRLAKINVDRAEKLVRTQAAAQVDLDTWNANLDVAAAAIDMSEAQLEDAQWKLGQTVVRAPHEGYVVNVQLRPGNVATTIPAASPMAFVSREASQLLASFSQSAVRRIKVGDSAEVVFVNKPGLTFSARVLRIVGFSQQSQLAASGQLPALSGAPVTDRWGVLLELEDTEMASGMPQGTAGTVAIYTDAGEALHMVSRVAIRMSSWLNYLTSA